MIDASTVDWVKLTRFASTITLKATGKACIVRAGCADGSWGSQGYDGRFWEVELSLDQPRTSIARTFLHEVGHAQAAHCKKTIAAGGVGLRSVEYLEDADFRDRVRARLHTIEREANEFADVAQATFEREFGPAWLDWPFVG